MWRKLWLLLVLVRLYFAFNPSYIHPDEHFQGPEPITGLVFNSGRSLTWEFTDYAPIRSYFPLCIIYGAPLTLLKWIWEGLGYGPVSSAVAFYTLRLVMFMLSFILEDWAIYELVPLPKDRPVAITLIASSYVTWTFQTHTFSNSIETLIVLWAIVLIKRIRDDTAHTQITACLVLAFLGVLGIFNRITFPAFILIPAVQLIPHLLHKPFRILVILIAAIAFSFSAVLLDTSIYTGIPITEIRFRRLIYHMKITPWNNFAYNRHVANLARHGLHPFYQHFLANLPQLLGTAVLLLPSSNRNTLFWTAITGIALLSCFQHQEARFLQPAIPLLLASIRLPQRFTRAWIVAWVLFNTLAGILFGIYHQGGIVPAQTWIAAQPNISQVISWKTYPLPQHLLDGRASVGLHLNEADNIAEYGVLGPISVGDYQGMAGPKLLDHIETGLSDFYRRSGRVLLVAPASATFLDAYTANGSASDSTARPTDHGLKFEELWRYRAHIGLDDLDFAEDGVWRTLQRVVGRRGLVIWEVSCLTECQERIPRNDRQIFEVEAIGNITHPPAQGGDTLPPEEIAV